MLSSCPNSLWTISDLVSHPIKQLTVRFELVLFEQADIKVSNGHCVPTDYLRLAQFMVRRAASL
jgi:hypothetical protein